MKPNQLKWTILLIALFKIISHLWFYDILEPHRDELLYFSLGTHPSGGYASVPPMIGWLAFLLMKTIGFSAFAIKILPAILGGIMVWLVAKIAGRLGGAWFAQILAAIGILIAPLFIRPFYLYQPVCFDIFFWTLIFFFTISYLNTYQSKFLILLGIASGLAILNKHLVFLQLIALFASFLLTSERKIFKQKAFLYALLACILIALPNIIWQISNGFPSLMHLNALNKSQLVYLSRAEFLKEQLLMPGIFTFLTIAGLLALFFSNKLKKFRLLGISALIVVVTLLLMQGKGYYTAGIFPLLLAAGAVWWESFLQKWYFKTALVLVLIILSLPLIPVGIPTYPPQELASYFKSFTKKYGMEGVLRHEDGKIHSLPQDYADMLGWEELASITNQAYQLTANKNNTIIYCENYGQASAVNILGKKYGLPEPISFSDNYYYWFPRKFPHEMNEFIYINDELGEDVSDLFQEIKLVGKISNPLAREYGTQVYLCQKPKESFNQFWEKRVVTLDNPFK